MEKPVVHHFPLQKRFFVPKKCLLRNVDIIWCAREYGELVEMTNRVIFTLFLTALLQAP